MARKNPIFTNGARGHSQRPGPLRESRVKLCSLLLFFYLGSLPHHDGLAFAASKDKPPEARGAPAARLLHNEFASEQWELTARFDSGHLLFVNFLITNIGWGDRNAVVVGHIVAPDGQTHQFDNARREGNWRLSADRLRLEIGPNVLDLHEPRYQLVVNKKSSRLDLRFHADGPALWSEALSRSGYSLDLLAAAAPVEGTLWTKGMGAPITVHGTLAATHSWMKKVGSSLMVRRLEFFALREDFPLYGIDLMTPDGARRRWLVVKQQGTKVFESEAVELSLEKELNPEKDPGYTVPSELQFKSATLNGHVQLERVALRNDPFANLPGPLRLLTSATLNLHPRRVWAVSPFAITLPPSQTALTLPPTSSTAVVKQQGAGVTAITFLNPVPDSRRVKH